TGADRHRPPLREGGGDPRRHPLLRLRRRQGLHHAGAQCPRTAQPEGRGADLRGRHLYQPYLRDRPVAAWRHRLSRPGLSGESRQPQQGCVTGLIDAGARTPLHINETLERNRSPNFRARQSEGSICLGAATAVHQAGPPGNHPWRTLMKRFALLATAALLASPVAFADTNLCQTNLQDIDDNMATNMATLGEPAKSQVEEYVEQARQAQQAGDTEPCIAHTTNALHAVKSPGSCDSGGNDATGSGASNGPHQSAAGRPACWPPLFTLVPWNPASYPSTIGQTFDAAHASA